MLRAIKLIAEKTIGRSKLAEELKVGEGTVRTIISRLKDAELIITSKAGCVLTDKSIKFWNEHKMFPRRRPKLEKTN